MKKAIYFILTLLLVGLFISISLIVYTSLATPYDEERKMHEEYPLLDDIYEDSIAVSGVVIQNQFYTRAYKSYHITLSNGKKFALWTARNYLYTPNTLVKFLQINDSVYKPIKTDSLYVYRDGKEYYFILGKIINRKE
jgi:hypothetical protein